MSNRYRKKRSRYRAYKCGHCDEYLQSLDCKICKSRIDCIVEYGQKGCIRLREECKSCQFFLGIGLAIGGVDGNEE